MRGGGYCGGRLEAYAVTSATRLEQLPSVPTMVESGYQDFVTSSWQGIFVPSGASREIVERLHAALLPTLKTPVVVERLAAGGVGVASSATPGAFAEFVAAETQRWGKAARDANASVD